MNDSKVSKKDKEGTVVNPTIRGTNRHSMSDLSVRSSGLHLSKTPIIYPQIIQQESSLSLARLCLSVGRSL